MDMMKALPMLAAVYVGAEYGGSIPAILIKTPGTSAASATVLDGYEMHLRGEGGKALFTSLISGVTGGIISVALLVLFVIPLSSFGLKFGPPQYALLGLMGLTVVGSVSGNNMVKGLMSALFGLLLATVGLDPMTGVPRFTFNSYKLMEGFDLIPVIVGFFAISEVLSQIFHNYLGINIKDKVKIELPNKEEFKKFMPVAAASSLIGTFVGALPGAGATIAAWLAYSQAKQFCKNGENFGKGDIRGVAAPESANNACPAGTLIPLLALGVPGSNAAAILLAGFNIHGIAPGPMLFSARPEIPYTMMACMLLAQFALLAIGILLIPPSIRITSISPKYMLPAILIFCFIGSFAGTNDSFAMIVACVFGVLGFMMKEFGFSAPAAVLGFVLGPLIENNVRRALVISGGELNIFFSGTINLALLAIIMCSLVFPYLGSILRKK
jgi:putative tricarboxylic transport membrane protein